MAKASYGYNKRRADPFQRMTARNAVPQQPEDEPQTREQMTAAQGKALDAPRKNDAAYQAYLRKGSKASGVKTASETGAAGTAKQGFEDKLIKAVGIRDKFESNQRRKARREIS